MSEPRLESRRHPRLARRLAACALAAFLGLAPAGAAQSGVDPPSTTPSERGAPAPIDEIRERARPFPIPTREGAQPGPRTQTDEERRVPPAPPADRGGDRSIIWPSAGVAALGVGYALWRVLRRLGLRRSPQGAGALRRGAMRTRR